MVPTADGASDQLERRPCSSSLFWRGPSLRPPLSFVKIMMREEEVKALDIDRRYVVECFSAGLRKATYSLQRIWPVDADDESIDDMRVEVHRGGNLVHWFPQPDMPLCIHAVAVTIHEQRLKHDRN